MNWGVGELAGPNWMNIGSTRMSSWDECAGGSGTSPPGAGPQHGTPTRNGELLNLALAFGDGNFLTLSRPSTTGCGQALSSMSFVVFIHNKNLLHGVMLELGVMYCN